MSAHEPQRREWRCSSCPAKLGEFDGDRVVIVIKRRTIRASYPVEQSCWSCGATNALDAAPTLDAAETAALSSVA